LNWKQTADSDSDFLSLGLVNLLQNTLWSICSYYSTFRYANTCRKQWSH